MPDYQVFGGVLRSQIELPELVASSTSPATWSLTIVSSPAPFRNISILGREQVEKDVEVVLAQHEGGVRLAFDDTGVFDVLDGGLRIEWTPPTTPDHEAVRKDILGRVFAVALHQGGIIALHGSAVDLGGAAVAFLAPKFHGKSTTATALVNAGGRLLADDVVAVSGDDPPLVLPSVPVVQLWRDSAERVGGGARAAPDASSPKLQVAWEASSRNATTPVAFGAVYLLAPIESGPDNAVRRDRMSDVEAAVALLGQAKVGALLGLERRISLLQKLAELAERVPVYRLRIPRDFDRIEELTTKLMAWHPASSRAGFMGGAT